MRRRSTSWQRRRGSIADRQGGQSMRFKDKVALITACGSGIGRATADIMATEGAFIVAVDNDQRRLDLTVETLNMTGGRAVGHCIDALNEREVGLVVDETAKNYGID